MKIVARYILKEHIGPLLFALSALTSLLLLNFIAKKFPDLVGKGLPWSVIVEFLLLSIPFTLAMTLPMAVLVATLHAFSRFASENEITAFKASGVSMQRLVRPVILASFVLAAGMVLFNDQVLPRANHRLATLQADIARVKPTLALNEQIINEVVRGQLYLRAARIESGSNRMRDVTIYDLSDRERRRTIRADSGNLAFSRTGEDLILTLYDGFTTELESSTPRRLQRSFFKEDLIAVRGIATRLERDTPTAAYKSDRELTVCELQQRVDAAQGARDTVWMRIQVAQRPGQEIGTPPGATWGIAPTYCAVQRWWRERSLVKEAQAAEPSAAADADAVHEAAGANASATRRVASVQRAVLDSQTPLPRPQPPAYDAVVLEGLRFELTSTDASIDRYRVEIEKKFSIAAACIVFVLLGAPIALRFPRGGVGLTIGVSLGVFGIYYVGLLAGEALSDRGLLDPALAMWATNAMLGIVGIYLTAKLGSEGSTSRGSETSEWWARAMERWRGRWARRRA
ncbi:MAG: LptF/LptG family permease [Gemmatimonadaceae bacterium]|nr:LptF/LptG family permease [Gemmatimonadaceae bacterium]